MIRNLRTRHARARLVWIIAALAAGAAPPMRAQGSGPQGLDTRLGWHIGEFAEFSVSGQNLAAGRHFEFMDDTGLFVASQVARSVSPDLPGGFN